MSKIRDMLGRNGIVSVDQALHLLHKHIEDCIIDDEIVPLEKALFRVSSQTISAPENLPSHPRSTMDGYAVRSSDTFGASESMPAYLEISGEVKMGYMDANGPALGTCFKIATGGLLPPKADAVVMLEHTINVDDNMIEVIRAAASGTNIIGTGEDVKKGDILIPQGHRIRSQDLGILSGLGIEKVSVKRRIKVGIISTGNEIVPFTKTPPPGKIRDINSVTLSGMVLEENCIPYFYGIVPDDEDKFLAVSQKAMDENDIVLFSGGSSVGSHDFGPKVIDSLGKPGTIVHGVAIKPGKPVIIAVCDGRPVFGLPGHPVSAIVCFDLFVRPAIRHLYGENAAGLPEWKTIRGRLMRNLPSAAGRRDFVRVRIRKTRKDKDYEVHPVLGKSGAISTLVKAHGYLVINESMQGLREGDEVEVRLFG